MEATGWTRIKELFHQAADLAPVERTAFLDRTCGDDDELRHEVESLLAADIAERGFIASAVAAAAGRFAAGSDDGSDLAGERIGPYLITGFIAKGGMGAVYRAEREHDFRMQVAIKLLKRGTDTDAALNRFRKERQILAGLEHPNIARLYDGGATEAGAPYFVMEYVDGVPLLEYFAPLSVRQRLELFRSVCAAVQYAHSQGILHRDIKPANILVTQDGIPKLLDFGIAKVLAAEGAATADTVGGVRLMTPDYASPEQLRGRPLTTATDIYSLGAVLYEGLTGQRAYQEKASSREDSDGEICPREPKRPSSAARRLDPDLDKIVLMALREEPSRRYASVDAFSKDLERWLQDLPIEAKKEGLLYRGRKFLKRNRRPTMAASFSAALVLLLLWGPSRWARPGTGADGGLRSIAVLPLDNLSGNQEQEYFADGMTDALISDLARIPGLRVISRTSTIGYKGARRPTPEIARALGVQMIAEGSVLRAGNRVRIGIRLVDAAKDRAIWSGGYEGDVRDILSLQSQVAGAIAGEIHISLTAPDRVRISSARRIDVGAYESYLKGRHALFRASVEDTQHSIQLFQQALEIDPSYASAYAGLADSYLSLSGMFMPPREAMAKAKAAATRALEFDPNLAEAHVSMAVVQGWYDFAWNKAEQEFKRAIDLNPNDASARSWYGQSLMSIGRTQEAIRQARLAHAIDPLSAFIEAGLGQIFFLSGQYELAIRQLQSVTESDPNFVHGHMFLGVAYLYTKQYKEAVRELEQAKQLDPRQPQSLAYLAYAHAKLGESQAAARDLKMLTKLSQSRYVSGYLFAVVSLGMRKNDALDWLERAYEDRDDMLAWLNVDAIFDELRPDARFKLLISKLGFDSVSR